MPLNRIYQGRVTFVEIGQSASQNTLQWERVNGGEECLWQHHALFQDAINYYLVALLALASRENTVLGPLLKAISDPESPLRIWSRFRRHGQDRSGLGESVAKYIAPGRSQVSMQEAFDSILAGNEASSFTRDAAVGQLLAACDGAGAIQQEGRAYWPKFCDPDSNANYAGDPVMHRRALHRVLLPQILHQPTTTWDSPALDPFDTYSIATPDARKPELRGSEARKRLEQAIALWRERRPQDGVQFDRLAQLIAQLSEAVTLPGYVGSSAKGEVQARLFALLLFKHVERSPFTFDLLRSSFPPPKTDAMPELVSPGEDPVRAARGSRGYIFPAFTALACWKGGDGVRPTWKAFDIAAFKYALTALNQVEEKTKERKDEAANLQEKLDHMHGKKPRKPPASEDEDGDAPAVIAGDPRVDLLRSVIRNLPVDTYQSDGEETEYGLHRRTIRGFRDLRRIWRSRVPVGTAYSPELQQQLLSELRRFQKDHSETIGSPALFEALLQPTNWPVWREPDPDTQAAYLAAGFADDPLAALVDEADLMRDIEALREPVKLTPADPLYSRRQYDFNAVSKFSAGPRAGNRHEPGRFAFSTEIALQETARWRPVRVRIHYSAPRLLRDGLRQEGENESISAARWLQPMMEAFSPVPEMPQDLTDMPVMLMPDASGERRVLLNFPLTLDPEAIIRGIGKRDQWVGQFCGIFKEPFALRWPADGEGKGTKEKAWVPWYRQRETFTVLGVDLGTRDAAALVHVTAACETPSKLVFREIGKADGKMWKASLTDMRMVKLAGEDASIFVGGALIQEHYGKKGRSASDEELREAREIISTLELDPDDYLGVESDDLSFPQLNDKLLAALRHAQSRLARLQSWSWRLRQTDETAAAAFNDLLQTSDSFVKFDPPPSNAPAAAVKILAILPTYRTRVTHALVQIANRVVPLRGRRWAWKRREEGSSYVLFQTDPGSDPGKKLLGGQRGVSHRRIEQLESLRHRCQSLNRTLQHAPGERPPPGSRWKGEALPDPCPDILAKIDRLREERVDQTAHAILAAALGVRLRAPAKDRAERVRRNLHGEYERYREPVDFIAIENLSRYLSSQDRARSENSRLMQWCHRRLVEKLRQLCETYGIPVLTVPAAYSSRFASRDGAAGFRAVEVSSSDRYRAPWSKILEKLGEVENGNANLDVKVRTEAEHVRRLFDQLAAAEAARPPLGSANEKRSPRTLLAPLPGGSIFVPLNELPPMQADLNAAANIALRAIAAPDRHDIHQRIRTERKGRGGRLELRRSTQREKARWTEPVPTLSIPEGGGEPERTPNVFTDVARVSFPSQQVVIAGNSLPFATGKALWGAVKIKAWNKVERLNEMRLRKWRDSFDETISRHPEI